jgi:hypothetical protein
MHHTDPLCKSIYVVNTVEFGLDRQIKSYWDKFIGLTDKDEQKFTDATSDHSVRTSKFLEGFDLEPIMPELNKHYSVPEGVETYPRRAMFKAMIWRKNRKIKYYTRTENHLNNHPDEALELETHVNGKGINNIDLHATQCCIALLAVALTRLQHGIKENISSVAYLT